MAGNVTPKTMAAVPKYLAWFIAAFSPPLALICTFLLFATTSSAGDGNAPAASAPRVHVLKTIIVDNYQPYTFVNGQGGADGFSVEIARAVAKTMGLLLELRAGTWKEAMKELESGKIDLLPMMAFSPERDKLFDFSVPHTIAYDTIFFKKGRPVFRSLKELAGQTVIVMNQDIAHSYLLSSGLANSIHLKLADSLPEALAKLADGQADAAIMPKLVGMVTVKKMGLVELASSPAIIDDYSRPFSFAVKEGNLALREELNQGLNIIKTTGEYDQIYKKWFGSLEGGRIDWLIVKKIGTVGIIFTLAAVSWNIILNRRVRIKTAELKEEVGRRRGNEEALRLSEERLKLAIRATEVGIWDWDVVNNQLTWDESMYHLYNLRPEEFAGDLDAWSRTLHPQDRPLAEAEIQAALAGEREYAPVFRILRPDGTERIIRAASQTFYDQAGKAVRMIGTNWDITEHQLAEDLIRSLNADLEQRVLDRTAQLEAANKELEAFAYSVSHDLRAPLRHINGYVELLLSRCRPSLDEKGLHYLDTIGDSAREMGVLIDDLLQFSRTGRAEMRREKMEMNLALQEALVTLQESQAGRVIAWTIAELPTVRGDFALLRQVWANLLGNAIKYTKTREVARIEVSCRRENGELLFLVADNGVGFDMQYASKLFGVFQRLHSLEEFEGTGIGLATVERIVNRHGGRVWAEAALNQGARFYFTLPLPEGEES